MAQSGDSYPSTLNTALFERPSSIWSKKDLWLECHLSHPFISLMFVFADIRPDTKHLDRLAKPRQCIQGFLQQKKESTQRRLQKLHEQLQQHMAEEEEKKQQTKMQQTREKPQTKKKKKKNKREDREKEKEKQQMIKKAQKASTLLKQINEMLVDVEEAWF